MNKKMGEKFSTNTSGVLSLSLCGALVPVMSSYGAEHNCKLPVKTN
jgi:hypothetical protein